MVHNSCLVTVQEINSHWKNGDIDKRFKVGHSNVCKVGIKWDTLISENLRPKGTLNQGKNNQHLWCFLWRALFERQHEARKANSQGKEGFSSPAVENL